MTVRALLQIPCFNEEAQLPLTLAAIRAALGPALGWDGDPDRPLAWRQEPGGAARVPSPPGRP